MLREFEESDEDFLPATQQSDVQDRTVGSVATFLWTKDAAHVRPVTHVHGSAEVIEDDEDQDVLVAAEDDGGQRHVGKSCDSANPVLAHSSVPIVQGDENPRRSPNGSTALRDSMLTQQARTSAHDWKVSRFASRSQPAFSRAFPLRSQDSADTDEGIEDDDELANIPPSTSVNTRNWRIPLQVRAEDAALRKGNDDLVDAREVDMQLGAAARDEEEGDLPGLQSTDDSESERDEDVAMDSMELQDFLRYRLPTGLRQLDKRLGLEAQHASLLFGDESIGLSNGGILEVAGTPGSGKTTLLMQLALQERISALLQAAASVATDAASSNNGHEGVADQTHAAREVVVIDTEGSISAERLRSMAVDLVAKSVAKAKDLHEASDHAALVEHTLAGIYVVRCTQMADLLATLEVLLPSSDYPEAQTEADQQIADRVLEAWDDMQMPPTTSLVVIDSISHLFRSTTSDDTVARRNRQHAFACVRTFCANLHSWGVKLVVSNQLSSVFVTSQGQRTRMGDIRGGTAYMRPTMRQWLDENTEADAWRIMLYFGDPLREDRRVKVVARPTSVKDVKYLDEVYWSTPTLFRINVSGVMEDVDITKDGR